MNDHVDLHMHSTHSDGVLDPAALVTLVANAGVTLFALTDHDTVDGLEAAASAARAKGLTAIPGVELSCRWLGRSLHVVGLGLDPEAATLGALLAELKGLRATRAEAIATALERAGAPGRAALEALGGIALPTRTHFARALVPLGAARDVAAAFSRYLARGKAGDIRVEWPALEQVVAAIGASGGVAVLAHPLRYMLSAGQRRQLVKEFRLAGGVALEVVTGGAAPHQVEAALGLALRAGLEGSVGSDCHDPGLAWHRPDRLAKLPEAVAPVWHRWDPTRRRALQA